MNTKENIKLASETVDKIERIESSLIVLKSHSTQYPYIKLSRDGVANNLSDAFTVFVSRKDFVEFLETQKAVEKSILETVCAEIGKQSPE